jgi:DNA mismatch endonuclease (patch repair protein)
MADVFSPAKRSAIMAAIKGKGTKTTEQAVRRLLRLHGIRGWRSHLKSIPGKPDFAFRKNKVALFIDGCFWHGCQKCRRNLRPATNSAFWSTKFAANKKRDRVVGSLLRKQGWRAIRFWEHEVRKTPDLVLKKIKALL